MALLRACLVLLALMPWASNSLADSIPTGPTSLYEKRLVVDPYMHTAPITSMATDKDGRWIATGSFDKTVRIWSATDAKLIRTIRLPAGPENIGKVYAVAMSPDAATIAAAGWTRWTDSDPQEQIYLFDRETGATVQVLEGLPSTVTRLSFSQNGRLLAATFFGGLAVYTGQSDREWKEIARVKTSDDSYGLAFSPDSRNLAITVLKGNVQLYDTATLRLTAQAKTFNGGQPMGVAFSPDGSRLAVGYSGTTRVSVFDPKTGSLLYNPDVSSIDNGDLNQVAWSRDGQTLFASGYYSTAEGAPVVSWNNAGKGAKNTIIVGVGRDPLISLLPTNDSELLVAARADWFSRVKVDAKSNDRIVWSRSSATVDFRNLIGGLFVSSDGTIVDFKPAGLGVVRFDLNERDLVLNQRPDGKTAAPRLAGLSIADWRNTGQPTLQGRPLSLETYEIARSVAVQPDGNGFVLGSDWFLRAFDADGKLRWKVPAVGTAWAVNISGDGRLVIVANDDGVIRWYRMSDGMQLLAFMPLMPLKDRVNWIAWTPQGYFAATPAAQGILRWQVNHAWQTTPDVIPILQNSELYRPRLLPLVLQELDPARALEVADQRSNAVESPLHRPSLRLVAIGISNYQDPYLQLTYANKDASDFATAIGVTQRPLYSNISYELLLDNQATSENILRSLDKVRNQVADDSPEDLTVFFFSGHSAVLNGKMYLVPYEVHSNALAMALSLDELNIRFSDLAKHSRVLVLLNGAYSGRAANLEDSSLDAVGKNMTVIAATAAEEAPLEAPIWSHSAFTRTILDALNDPAADPGHTGVINSNSLALYVHNKLPELTGGAQHAVTSVGFESALFKAGL